MVYNGVDNVADTHRLLKRGGTWYYVRRVPAHLVAAAGKPVIKCSLRTSNKAEAKKRRSIEDVKHDAWFATLAAHQTNETGNDLKSQPPNAASIVEYVRKAVASEDARSADTFISDAPDDADQLREMRIEAEQALEMLANPSDPRRVQLVASFGQKAVEQFGGADAHFDMDAPVFEIVRRGLIELFRRKIDRFDDRYDLVSHDPIFRPINTNGQTVSQLVAAFLSETREAYVLNGVSKKRLDKVTAHAAAISEMIGEATAVDAIGDDHVQLVRTTLSRMPAHRHKRFPDRSLAEALAANEASGGAVLSATTQGFYLDVFRDLLKLAVRKKLLPYNPAADARPIKKAAVAAADRRRPFSAEQIRKFFTGTFYTSCGVSTSLPYLKPDRAWRFWMPLIMLFSGARPNEIAQLRVSDVRETPAGTPYFNLSGDEPNGDEIHVKTESSRRRVPIHSELAKIGFLKFVAERRQHGGDARLFPTLKPNSYGNVAWYAAKRFNEVFLPAEIAVGDRQSLYSLRHSVRDALRRIDAPASALLAIAGWAPAAAAVSDDYGDKGDPDLNAKWVEGIAYPGLDLSFLHAPMN